MEKLLVFPFNGNGLEAIGCIQGQYDFIGFIDDTPEKQGKHDGGFEVFGREVLDRFLDAKVLAVPGSPTSFSFRNESISSLNLNAERFATLIHPSASISPFAQIGYNVLIMAGVVVTANSKIGNHVCILPNTVIHHDSNIGDYTLVGSNTTLAGNSEIGQRCYIGSGTSIINGIKIGDDSLIGIGSNVIRSVSSRSKVAGNPAKSLSNLSK
jgi:sugar O-acyltransferase (sialic acid O-acetyltransferase NeuD family)